MMQRYSGSKEYPVFSHDIVLSTYDESSSVDEGLFSYIDHVGKIFRYNLNCSAYTLLQHFPNALHYLDRFWILLPVHLKNQRMLWREFYRVYGSMYNQLVDCSNNTLCLLYFKRLLEERLLRAKNYKLLDFGCGTGFSADVFDLEHLVCYDIDRKMRQTAHERGLATINSAQFKALSPNSFDGCIACYVLHMAVNSYYIRQLAHVIKNDGVIVANFYKGICADRVNGIFRENNLKVEQIETHQGRFGSVYVYRKQ